MGSRMAEREYFVWEADGRFYVTFLGGDAGQGNSIQEAMGHALNNTGGWNIPARVLRQED
jgi:hypothetical protein